MNKSNIRKKYEAEGYAIFEQLIPIDKIDKLLGCFEQFKKSKLPFYSQSIHTWIKPPIDANGFMEESMENFTRVFWLKQLSKFGQDILLADEINEALQTIQPTNDTYAQWQNMFFDKSTGTIDHYDSYYLDTVPSGNLIGVWVALEDINIESGPFRVYPKSHLDFLNGKYDNLSHDDFRVACQEYSQTHQHKHALLRKGDVLLWHPSLMHGSDVQVSKLCSRKSLTAHYYPSQAQKKGDGVKRGIAKSLFYKLEKSPMRASNYPILSFDNLFNKVNWGGRGIYIYYKNKLLGKTGGRDNMKRASYN